MIWWHCCIEMEDAEQRTEDVVATISRHILGWEQPGDRDAVIESHGTLKIRLTCTLMLKVLFFHALEYLDRLGCWCGSPKDYSNHWPSLTFMGNTAPTEKQENRVWVAQGKSTILCHFGLLTALMKLITTISSSPSSCCSSTPPPRRPQYPEMYTGSNEVWGDVTMLTITDFSLDNIMLLVFATLISPSPSIRCSFINHSFDAVIVFSRIVDSVYSVWIHNGWWFSYPVIWFGPSEGRNDKASWLWPSSRPNQIYLTLMTYCTWQFLVSLMWTWSTQQLRVLRPNRGQTLLRGLHVHILLSTRLIDIYLFPTRSLLSMSASLIFTSHDAAGAPNIHYSPLLWLLRQKLHFM